MYIYIYIYVYIYTYIYIYIHLFGYQMGFGFLCLSNVTHNGGWLMPVIHQNTNSHGRCYMKRLASTWGLVGCRCRVCLGDVPILYLPGKLPCLRLS